jgi:membrane associated rhomboid family serine protease
MAETEKERIDRELLELLNELRVALPGVQVLFAFLLTIPFSSRFTSLTAPQEAMYFGTFLVSLLALAFLMAPSSYHRLRFRQQDKERLLTSANRFAIWGVAMLALALCGSSLLVADVLYGSAAASLAVAGTIGVLLWCWFGLPLARRARDGRAHVEDHA